MKFRDMFSFFSRPAALLAVFLLLAALPVTAAAEEAAAGTDGFDSDFEYDFNGAAADSMADPLEPLNRVFFHFNDKLYFWVLKPVATGYTRVVAEDIRMCVRDFFKNLLAPVRIVNNILQGKVRHGGIETARFVINSTLGIAGLADPAKDIFSLTARDEDFGQTLGVYGVGDGIYICWPILGPSNLRDTVGLVADSFINPLSYLTAAKPATGIAAQAGRDVNNTSLTLGDYEDFKAAAIDPYVSLRDAYRQHRRKKISDTEGIGNSVYSSLEEPGAAAGPPTATAPGEGEPALPTEAVAGVDGGETGPAVETASSGEQAVAQTEAEPPLSVALLREE